MKREAPAAWRALGGARTLAATGVVRAADVESQMEPHRFSQDPKSSGRLWTLMTFESWLQHRRPARVMLSLWGASG